jgi:hypothetical protein
LIVEARVEPATTYRVIVFGPLGNGGAGAQTLDNILLSPTSEAAVRLLAENGLQNFDDDGVDAVIDAVQVANANTNFAGQGAEQAVLTALGIARADSTVESVIEARRTPGPSATPTNTRTATSTPTVTRTPTVTPTATRTRTRPPGSPIMVLARAVGAAVQEPPSAGVAILPQSNMRTLTVSLLANPAASNTSVTVTSTNAEVATVLGTVVIPTGSRAATLDVRTGSMGEAVLKLRAGSDARDLRIVVGSVPDDLPPVVARDVGISVQSGPSAGQIFVSGAGQRTFTITLLSAAAASDTPVTVTTTDAAVADVIGSAFVPAGSRAVTLDVEIGSSGTAVLRLRAGADGRNLEITIGTPAEGEPPVIAPIVGVAVQ